MCITKRKHMRVIDADFIPYHVSENEDFKNRCQDSVLIAVDVEEEYREIPINAEQLARELGHELKLIHSEWYESYWSVDNTPVNEWTPDPTRLNEWAQKQIDRAKVILP